MLVVNHKLFCSCCSLIHVVVLSSWGLFIHCRKFVIWCCNWMSQILYILYRYGFNIVLLGIDLARCALCLATVRYLERILLQVECKSTMLYILYSRIGIITVLIIYMICLLVIFLVFAIWIN